MRAGAGGVDIRPRGRVVRGLMRRLVLAFALVGLGCSAVEKAAARDPMRCERDPACAGKLDKSRDCATACADDVDCTRRCEEVRGHR
jgi:hypothetical protein